MKKLYNYKKLKIIITSLIISSILFPSLNAESFRLFNLEKESLLNNFNNNLASILYVGGSGIGNYSTIQSAINAAASGDTVFIYDDSSPYYENIVINKTIDLIGENRNTTVINGNNNGDVLYIFGNNGQYLIKIKELMITNSGNGPYDAGIELNQCKYCIIQNNILSNDPIGLYINNSDANNILSNKFSLNNVMGIYSYSSDGITLDYNKIENNTIGALFYNSRNCYIRHNEFYNNNIGINISKYCYIDQVYNNSFIYNIIGVVVYSNNNIYVLNNLFSQNDYAILIEYTTDIEINYNECFNNNIGLYLIKANGNEMEHNILVSNNIAGVLLFESNNNLVRTNNFNNNNIGIELNNSNSNTINYNTCNNGSNGIIILFNSTNLISNNICNNNTNSGIILSSTIDNTISSNDCLNNNIGINIKELSNTNTIVQNFCSNSFYGIYIDKSNINEINSNTLSDNINAINIYDSNNNTIGNNIVSNNIDSGLTLHISVNNIILSNDFINNSIGVNITQANYNNITDNSCYYGIFGVYLYSSNFNLINLNDCSENINGIFSNNSTYNLIENNTYSTNNFSAINLSNSNFNTIKNNLISSNNEGLKIYSSSNNLMTSNIIKNNNNGIEIITSTSNLIYNNLFYNTNNANDNSNNIWNISKTSGINIIGGAYLGGNYWHNYNGSDLNNDGLGDTYLPYNNLGNIQNNGDWLPLVNAKPYEPSNPNPADGAVNVSTNIELKWTGGDPDPGDTTKYDVYFDINYPPQTIVSLNQTNTSYPTGQLEANTKYYWRIIAWDLSGDFSIGPIWNFTTSSNLPPDTPVINGRNIGKPGVSYKYIFMSIDPDEDDLYYNILWGDGSFEDWIGPFKSDEIITVEHTWHSVGSFKIMARVKDVNGAISDWGTFTIYMPRNGLILSSAFIHFLEKLYENHPIIWHFIINYL